VKGIKWWIDTQAAYLELYYRRGLKNFGLTGKDGDLSFAKTFGLLVLASYYFNSNLPASVAITLIVSAHGTKLLLELIHAWKARGFPLPDSGGRRDSDPDVRPTDSDERG
jgi:hypothetical protein